MTAPSRIQRQDGFTLVELLIVVIILAILIRMCSLVAAGRI